MKTNRERERGERREREERREKKGRRIRIELNTSIPSDLGTPINKFLSWERL